MGCEIEGKTLGVIGLGAIGGKVVNAALSLGMKVVGFDPVLSLDAAWKLPGDPFYIPTSPQPQSC